MHSPQQAQRPRTDGARADGEASPGLGELPARPAAAPDVLQGRLEEHPLPEVLLSLSRSGASGALLLEQPPVRKLLFLREGRLVEVRSNRVDECLGRVMVREGLISEAQCEASLQRARAQERRQGEVLLELGCISPLNLTHALRLQLRQRMQDLFGWSHGTFLFNPAAPLPAGEPPTSLSLPALVVEGVRTGLSAERARAALAPAAGLYPCGSGEAAQVLAELELEEEARALLQAVDGRHSVAALRALELLPVAELDRLLLGVWLAGLVEMHEGPAPQRQPLLPAPSAPLPRPPPLRPRTLTPPPLPPRAEGMALSEEAEQQALAARVAEVRGHDFFHRLGVDRHASSEEVEQAYARLRREVDPEEAYRFSSPEVRRLAGELVGLLTGARDTLTDTARRLRYAAELGHAADASRNDGVDRLVVAEGRFQQGLALLRQGQPARAQPLLEEAVALCPAEAEFHAWLGWALFQQAPWEPARVDTALRCLERALALEPTQEQAHLLTADLWRTIGRPDRAVRHYEQALARNPHNPEAAAALRLLRGD